MSSNARKAEKRRENDAAYERDCQEREEWEAAREAKYGEMLAKLETLGIDASLLREYVLDQERWA